jgi:putative transposase
MRLVDVMTWSLPRTPNRSLHPADSVSPRPETPLKLIESAQERWRSVNAPHLVALVRAGARFERGVLVEREQATSA